MNYDGKPVCGVTDAVGDVSCQWPMRDVRIYSEGLLGGVSIEEATRLACERWNAVCGINLTHTKNLRTANIVVTKGGIDNRGGTLAWSELPCFRGHIRQLQQKYDTGEIWCIADNPGGGRIDLARVMCHEIGHAIGISHIASGNLMQPMYDTHISTPQNGDIIEARARYGPPVMSPQPTPGEDRPDFNPPLTPGRSGLWGLTASDLKILFQAFIVLRKVWKNVSPQLTSDERQAASLAFQELKQAVADIEEG